MLISGVALAQQPLDLVSAWQSAERHDPVMAAARADLEAGRQKQKQGRARLLPQVQGSAAVGLSSIDSTTTGAQFTAPGFGTSNDVDFRTNISRGNQQRWQITAQQPLYDAARFASSRQLSNQAELAAVQYSAAQQELILRVTQAYFDLLIAQDNEALLAREKAASETALAEARARFDSGDTAATDMHEAQARHDTIAAQFIAAQSATQLMRSALIDITGVSDTDQVAVPASGTLAQDAGTLAQWQERAARDNPLLAMQSLGVEIARADVDKFSALTSPVFDLVAQAGDQRLHGDGDYGNSRIESSSWLVGVQVTVPIFTGGMRSARRAEAVALADKARSNLAAVRQQVARQVQAAWLGVTSGAAQVRALEQAQQSAQARLASTRMGRDTGARTTLDLLNAETDLLGAERALRQARCNLLINQLRLAATAGALDENQLRATNEKLQRATTSP
jgi:outer membrane protein